MVFPRTKLTKQKCLVDASETAGIGRAVINNYTPVNERAQRRGRFLESSSTKAESGKPRATEQSSEREIEVDEENLPPENPGARWLHS